MHEKLSFGEVLRVDNGVIFSDIDGSGIYFLEKDKREAKLLVNFPYNLVGNKMLYKSLMKADTKIFLPPCLAKDILVYDYNLKTTQLIKLETLMEDQKDLCKFWTSILYDNYIYFIGHYYPAIVKINIFTMELSYLTDWVEQIERRRKLEGSPYLGIGIIHENIALFPCCCSNAVLRLDLNTDKTIVYDIQTDIEGFNGICFSRDRYWLTSRNSYQIAILEKNMNDVETMDMEAEERYSKGLFFRPPLLFSEKLYLFPATADHVYCIDTVDRKIQRIRALDEILDLEQDGKLNFCKISSPPILIDHKIYFVTGKDNVWHIFDPITNSLENFIVQADPCGNRAIKIRRFLNAFGEDIAERNATYIVVEEEGYSCKDFCDVVNEYKDQLKYFKLQLPVTEENIGRSIYRKLNR